MEFKSLVQSRYSCRSYSSKKVSKELIIDIIDISRNAPSAVNYQPWRFIYVDDIELLGKVRATYHREWFNAAPGVLIAIAETGNAWIRSDGKNHSDIDLALIIDHITLAATEKGLATCWVCNFNVSEVINLFRLRKDEEPVALIPIGYPTDSLVPVKKRKKLEQILTINPSI